MSEFGIPMRNKYAVVMTLKLKLYMLNYMNSKVYPQIKKKETWVWFGFATSQSHEVLHSYDRTASQLNTITIMIFQVVEQYIFFNFWEKNVIFTISTPYKYAHSTVKCMVTYLKKFTLVSCRYQGTEIYKQKYESMVQNFQHFCSPAILMLENIIM